MVNLLAADDVLSLDIEACQLRSRYEDSEGRQDCLRELVALRRRQDAIRRLLTKGKLSADETEIEAEAY